MFISCKHCKHHVWKKLEVQRFPPAQAAALCTLQPVLLGGIWLKKSSVEVPGSQAIVQIHELQRRAAPRLHRFAQSLLASSLWFMALACVFLWFLSRFGSRGVRSGEKVSAYNYGEKLRCSFSCLHCVPADAEVVAQRNLLVEKARLLAQNSMEFCQAQQPTEWMGFVLCPARREWDIATMQTVGQLARRPAKPHSRCITPAHTHTHFVPQSAQKKVSLSLYNIYIYTLTLQRPLIFGVFQEKLHFFSESIFFEIKYCFLHVSDVHSWRYSWNCGNQINGPHCQLATHCCRCHFCFGCVKVQEQRFPNISKLLVLVYVFDAMVSILLALGFGRALLFHYCTHEGRSQHSVADTRVHCSILVTTCPWKICPYNAHMQRPFFFKRTIFCWGPSGRRPKVRKNASKVRKYPSGLDPSEPKGFFYKKRTFFFTSVRPSVKTVSAAGTRRSGRVDVLKPRVYFRISVAMCKCLPLQLIIKSRRRFYISTRIVDPKLFSHEVLVMRLGLNDVWGCLIQH